MLVECPSALKAEQRMAGVETLLWVLTQLGRLIDFYQLIGSEHTHTHRILSFLRYTLLGQKLLQTLNAI